MNARLSCLRTIAALSLCAFGGGSSLAASIERRERYFAIGGATLSEIEAELARRGPRVAATGQRHPGATRMKFDSRIDYRPAGGSCAVARATVRLSVEIVLPKWTAPRAASSRTHAVWAALSDDMRRHEEDHVHIAQRYATELERVLALLGVYATCELAEQAVRQATDRVLARHDAAQAQFDRIESRGFSERIGKRLRD